MATAHYCNSVQSGTTAIVTDEGDGNDNNGGVTIYTDGYYNNGRNDIACYWTGTTKTDLPIPAGASDIGVRAIIVLDRIVYTIGYYKDSSDKLIQCYWKGTAITSLPIPSGATEYTIRKRGKHLIYQ